jgi:peptidoglycan/LPS O-acetylase OafA/YrhL
MTTRRIPELDAVRGLASLAVATYHLFGWLGPSWESLGQGVDAFFVLSGYLITSIILNNSHRPSFYSWFYSNRALRIFPVYYLGLALIILSAYVFQEPGRLQALGYYLTFTQYTFCPTYWFEGSNKFDPAFNHSWTLAIEVQFYLFWPVLVIAAGRRRLPILAGLAFVTAIQARSFGYPTMMLLTRLDGFAVGALLAWLFSEGEPAGSDRRRVVLGLSLALLAALALPATKAMSIYYSLLAIFLGGVVGLILLHAGQPCLRLFRLRPLTYLGEISYGLYLYHWIVYYHVDRFLPESVYMAWWTFPIKAVVSLGITILSWEYFEKPILRLKKRHPGAAALEKPGAERGTSHVGCKSGDGP